MWCLLLSPYLCGSLLNHFYTVFIPPVLLLLLLLLLFSKSQSIRVPCFFASSDLLCPGPSELSVSFLLSFSLCIYLFIYLLDAPPLPHFVACFSTDSNELQGENLSWHNKQTSTSSPLFLQIPPSSCSSFFSPLSDFISSLHV